MYDVFVRTAVAPGAASHFAQTALTIAGSHTGVYLVGSPALGDPSPRQSNTDLVVVTREPLSEEHLGRLAAAHRPLGLNGRAAAVCYTTWAGLAGAPEEAPASVFEGRNPAPRERLANPMTWAILASNPMPLAGPDRPEVDSAPDQVRSWFRQQLPAIVDRTGRLLWRRHLSRVVLQSTRAAHGALTGEVVSLRRAGELALPGASHTGQRVITDALGYRAGANTSMYWGPFERKSNAATLGADLLRRVG